MIIDFHTHTFPDSVAEHALKSLQSKSHSKAFSDGTAEGLVKRDDEAGIDLAVILPVATNAGQVININDRAAELNRSYYKNGINADDSGSSQAGSGNCVQDSGRPAPGAQGSALLSFACIHPGMEDAESELRRVKNMGFRGIKIHPAYQGMDIDARPYVEILETSAELGLIVVTHAGWDIGIPGAEECLPDKIRRAVNSADPEGKTLKFVAAHMGGWRAWNKALDQLADTGVYIDTSFSTGRFYPSGDGYYDGKDTSLLDRDGFMKLFDAFGKERILFGTDNPWSSAEESIEFIKGLPVTEEARNLILGGNGERLLRECGA